VDQN
jgi:hypothetical protein